MKIQIMGIKDMKSVLLFIGMLLLLTGCTDLLDGDQQPPMIIKVVEKLSMRKNETITLSLDYVGVFDINGDPISLLVYGGENFTVDGLKVTPIQDFTGLIAVPIQAVDTAGLVSNMDSLLIVVSDSIIEIQPLFDGGVWSYVDTFFQVDSVSYSKLQCGLYSYQDNEHIFALSWDDIAADSVAFLYRHTPLGLQQIGAVSPVDTLLTCQYKLRYPALPGEQWEYAPIRKKGQSGFLFQESSSSGMTLLDTAAYVTVPAGSFKCLKYGYNFQLPHNREAVTYLIDGIRLPASIRGLQRGMVTVHLYYAPEVGLIQCESFMAETKVSKKMLRATFRTGAQ